MKKILTILSITLCFYCKKKVETVDKPNYQLITIIDINPSLKDPLAFEKEEAILKNTTLTEGSSTEALLENANKYYLNYWQNKKDYYVINKIQYNVDSTNSIIETLRDNISIKYNSEKFAILNKPSVGMDELSDVSNTDDIWILSNNTWKPYLEYIAKFQKATIEDLNNDGFKDVTLIGGCCDTESLAIFLASKNGEIKYTQEITLIGIAEINIKENCKSKISLKSYQDEDYIESAKFDCKLNKFVVE